MTNKKFFLLLSLTHIIICPGGPSTIPIPSIPHSSYHEIRIVTNPDLNITLHLVIDSPAFEKATNAFTQSSPILPTLGVLGVGMALMYCGWQHSQKDTRPDKVGGYIAMTAGALLTLAPFLVAWIHRTPILV